jgi:hypothetical protein
LQENEYIADTNNDKICKLNWHNDYLNAHNRKQILRKVLANIQADQKIRGNKKLANFFKKNNLL